MAGATPQQVGVRSSSPVALYSSTTAAPSMASDRRTIKVLLSSLCWMGGHFDRAGSLYEQAGPAELSILPDNTWDGCGDKKRYFFLEILGRLSLKIIQFL